MDRWQDLEPYLPGLLFRLMEEAGKVIRGFDDELSEVRIGREVTFLSLPARQIPLPCPLGEEGLQGILLRFCHGAVYACREGLEDGFVCPGGGIRVGIGGRYVRGGGIRDLNCLTVRIPHEVPGAGREAVRAFGEGQGMLIFSPPGGGKTTLLRDFIATLAGPPRYLPVAVADARGELSGTLPHGANLCLTEGLDKATAISMALRHAAPRCLVCDEIGGADVTEAILESAVCGVPLVATTHAGSVQELYRRPSLSALLRAGVFPVLLSLEKGPGGPVCRRCGTEVAECVLSACC